MRKNLSAGKFWDKTRSGGALSLTPIHPTTTRAPGEKENSYLLTQLWGHPGSGLGGHFLPLSQPPAPPGNKYYNMGNGEGPKQEVGGMVPSRMKCREPVKVMETGEKQEMGVLNLLRMVRKGSWASEDTGRRDARVGTWAPEDALISPQLRKCTWGKEN